MSSDELIVNLDSSQENIFFDDAEIGEFIVLDEYNLQCEITPLKKQGPSASTSNVIENRTVAIQDTEDSRVVKKKKDGELEITTRSESSIEPKRKSGKKGSECPWCHKRVDQVGRHVQQIHLPWYFAPESGCWKCQTQEGTVTYLRCKHLLKNCSSGGFITQERLITWCALMGGLLDLFVKAANLNTPQELLDWAIANKLTPTSPSYEVPVVRVALYTHLAVALHLGDPQQDFSMTPPSSPVCLLQWEVVHKMYRALHMQTDLTSYAVLRSQATMMGPLFIDAHVHLDRTLNRLRMDRLPEGKTCDSHQGEKLQFLISNCVFPDEWRTWQRTIEDPRVFLSFGCHPGVNKTPAEAGIVDFCHHPRCVAIGECGLDLTYNIPVGRQVAILRAHLVLARQLRKPVVLHLRSKEANQFQEVYHLALETLQEVLEVTHRVYLHSFSGDAETSRKWLRAFPNTLFGISGMWWKTRELSKGITSLPLTKITLETDSPYLPAPGDKFQHPHRICRIADAIGRRRNLPGAIVMEIARRNALRFFW